MALKVGELFASFNLDTSGVGSAISGAEKSLSNMGKGLAIGGAAMTAAVTAPIVNLGKEIYKAGSGFDSQMSKVFAIAGDEVTDSAEAMEKLRAKALEMGSTTQFTATEAGQAFEYMAMAGWDTESMLAAIEPLMNLAAAAGADLGTTSDIVTDAMTAFGLKATDMVTVYKDGMAQSVSATEYFADILAATSSSSNTNVTMLGESFKYVAPLAGSLGYSLNDVALALGLMANNGIKSSMAGTSLSRVIQNMTKPSKEVQEAMDALGLSLYDSKGQAKSLREVMGDFRSVAKKNGVDVSALSNDVAKLTAKFEAGEISEAEYDKQLEQLTEGCGDFMKYVTQIAGARGLPGLLAIMNASDEDFNSLSDSIDNATGSAKKMKDVMLDNVGGAATIFKSAVEGLEITLWDLVKGPVKALIEKGTGIVDKFRQMDSATQMGALKMAAFAAAIGPVMTAAGGLLMALPKIARGIALLTSPLGLVSIGLLALGAGAMDAENLMGKNLEKMAATASDSMKKLYKKLLGRNNILAGRARAFLGSVQKAIITALPDILDTLTGVLQIGLSALGAIMPDAAKTATTLVTTLAQGMARNAPVMARTLAKTLTSLATSVIGAVPEMLHAGITLFTALIDAVGKVNWLDIGKKLNEAVTTALKEIRTNFYTLVFGKEPTEKDLGDWGALGSKLVENIKAGIKQASDNGKNLLGGLVLGNDYNPDDSWGTVAGKIWNKITETMGKLLKNSGDLIKGLVLGKDYKASATWSGVARAIWDKIKNAFTTLKKNVKDLIGTIALGKDYQASDTWGKISTAIWAKIKEKFNGLKAGAKDLIGEIVLGEDYKPDTTWEKIGTAIWDKIKEKIKALKDGTKNIVGKIVLGEAYTADTKWGEIAQAIWDTITNKIAELKSNAKNIVGKIVLGEGYTADSSWGDIGVAIWNQAKARFASLAKIGKNLIGKLVLGEGYKADTSWGEIGVAIWNKAKERFHALAKIGKNLIGKLVLGANYSADKSWKDVGTAVWEKAKSGFDKFTTNVKDFIGSLVLGENYSADDNWSTVGAAIWEKVTSGISATGDWIKALVLKDEYNPESTWKDVGEKLWDEVKNAFTVTGDWIKSLILKDEYNPEESSWKDVGDKIWSAIKTGITDTGDWIKSLVLGEEYTADASWSDVGKKLWEKVQSGITAGKSIAESILEKIGNVEIDVEGVLTTVKNAGTFVTNLVGNMLDGRITWGSKIVDLARKIADKFGEYGWTGLGGTLGKVANNLIQAIVGAIPKAVNAAGEAVDTGLMMATAIIDGIVEGFNGEGGLNFSGIVQGIVNGLTEILPKALEIGGKALTAGAHIAQSLFGAIASALADVKASGVAEQLGEATTSLLKNLLSNISGLKDNTEINTFLTNIGTAIIDGMGTLGSILGDFCGKLLGYLFSAEGLKDLYNAGTTIVDLILKGMAAGMSGVLNFLGNMVDSILIQVGIIDPEARSAAKEAGEKLAATAKAAMEEGFSSYGSGLFRDLIDWSLAHGDNATVSGMDSKMLALFNGYIGDAAREAGDSAEKFMDEFMNRVIEGKYLLDEDFWQSIFPEFTQTDNDYNILDYVSDQFDTYEDIVAFVREKLMSDDMFPKDMNLWAKFLEAYNSGDYTALMNLMNDQALALYGITANNSKEAADEAAAESNEAVQAAMEELGIAAEKASADMQETVTAAMEEAGNTMAKEGFVKAIADGTEPVEDAALKLSDAVVQEFLLTMSAENAYLIGENYVLSLGSALSDQTETLSGIAKSVGQTANTALSSSASYANGYTIGVNFGTGFVNGIRSMIDEAAKAAAELGAAGTGGLSSSIEEGSPSKLTTLSGRNFDLGFIEGILGLADNAADAASTMGVKAAQALEYTARGIGAEAAEQASYPQKSGYTRTAEAYHSSDRAGTDAERIAEMIMNALNGMGLYFDGELAGHILTKYISEEIARGAAMRR